MPEILLRSLARDGECVQAQLYHCQVNHDPDWTGLFATARKWETWTYRIILLPQGSVDVPSIAWGRFYRTVIAGKPNQDLWYHLYHGSITLDDLRYALAKSQ